MNVRVVNVEGCIALLAGKRKNIFWLICAGLIYSLVGLGQSVSADTISENLRFSGDSTPVALDDVILSSSAVVVGSASQLQVRFTTPDLEFPFDYRVGVTFPTAFGFDNAVSAVFSDDSPAPDTEIQLIEIVDHTVIFTFRRTFFAPKAGQVGIIDISGVTLPTASGAYAATVFISDIDFVVLAGPTFTSEVTLVPDVASSVALSPVANVVVTAGELLSFVGNSVDQYGNAVSDSTLDWRLTDDSDSLGVVTPGTLLATKTGSGRVVVSSGIAADTSGVITVVAGALARLEIDIDRQQYVGGGICGKGFVRAFDQFGNPKGNFSGTDTLLELIVSEGTMVPESLPISAFDSNGVLDLAKAGVQFEGFVGETDIVAGLGSITSASEPVSLGGMIIRFPYDNSQVTDLPAGKRISTTILLNRVGSPLPTPDSVTGEFPGGGRFALTNPTHLRVSARLPDFLTTSVPTDGGDDTLLIVLYGSILKDSLTNETIHTVNTVRLPLRIVDRHITHSTGTDTLLSGARYFAYDGFELHSPLSPDRLLDGSAFVRDTSGRLFRFGQYGGGNYRSDSNGVDLRSRMDILGVPPEFGPGIHGVTAIVTLIDGPYKYQDTAFADSQLYLVEPAYFVADASELSPVSTSPGDSVLFALPVSVERVFDDSTIFAVTLQLYSEDTVMSEIAAVSRDKDSIINVKPIKFPMEFAQTSWGVRFVMQILESRSDRYDTLDLGPDVFQVGPVRQINVLGLNPSAPNFPFVSAGQDLGLVARIVNDAPFVVSGVQVVVDAMVVDTTVVTVGDVGAGDTIDVTIPFAAGSPASLQTVIARVTSANGAREESSAQIQFTVQSPALLSLKGNLNLQQGAEGQLVSEIGSPLSLQLQMENAGEADVTGGSALITATGAGLDFSAIVELSAPVVTKSLGVASLAGIVNVTASILDKPRELNSGQDASFAAGSAIFAEKVLLVDRELVVNANITPGDTSAVAFGELREMFSVELSNASPLEDADIEVLTVAVLLHDAKAKLINPSAVIDVARSALFNEQGKAIAILRVSGDTLLMDMTPNTLGVGEKVNYKFVAQFSAKSLIRTFSLSVPTDGIILKAISGPREGARFVAEAPSGAPPFGSKEYTLTSAAFVESFQPQNNPFNPDNGATQFSYTLSSDNDIELAVYTLTGKLVRRFNFSSGSQYASSGVQTPSWDGRNGNGDIVRDGVYVVALTNLGTGEKAFLKQAVLR